jgi:hypothetical protein
MRPSASTNTCSARLITACITCSGCERTRKFEPLAPGDSQRVSRPIEKFAQPHIVADLISDSECCAACAVVKMGTDQNVLAHRQADKGLHDLEGSRDAASCEAMRRLAGNVLAGVADGAAARLDESGDDRKERGLAGTVGTDERGDMSFRGCE